VALETRALSDGLEDEEEDGDADAAADEYDALLDELAAGRQIKVGERCGLCVTDWDLSSTNTPPAPLAAAEGVAGEANIQLKPGAAANSSSRSCSSSSTPTLTTLAPSHPCGRRWGA
jgi:hypothetical protein